MHLAHRPRPKGPTVPRRWPHLVTCIPRITPSKQHFTSCATLDWQARHHVLKSPDPFWCAITRGPPDGLGSHTFPRSHPPFDPIPANRQPGYWRVPQSNHCANAHFCGPWRLIRPCSNTRQRGHPRTLSHPGPHHPRCPHGPRHLRQGQDRVRQDSGLRPRHGPAHGAGS